MAVDTRNKRMSLLALGLWLGRVVSDPDGGIDTKPEHSQWALSYAMAWSGGGPVGVPNIPGKITLRLGGKNPRA